MVVSVPPGTRLVGMTALAYCMGSRISEVAQPAFPLFPVTLVMPPRLVRLVRLLTGKRVILGGVAARGRPGQQGDAEHQKARDAATTQTSESRHLKTPSARSLPLPPKADSGAGRIAHR